MASLTETMHAGAHALLAGMIGQDEETAISAAGTTQATATQTKASISVVSTVAASAGVILRSANGRSIELKLNTGANTLTVYPAIGEKMNGTTNGSVQIATGKSALFVPHINGWYSNISA